MFKTSTVSYGLLLFFTVCACAARDAKTSQQNPIQNPNVQKGESGYESFRIGNALDISTTPTAGFLLAGGGQDVTEGMRWLLNHANGGDFLVLRASGDDDYNEWINELGKVNSVETLIITSRTGASQPYVQKRIAESEAIFIAGGGQDDYIHFWKDTPMNAKLNEAIRRGVPVGGTSAGLAVLGEFVYDAFHGSVVSSEALNDPYDSEISFSKDFLNIYSLQNVITDSHFAARNRMGRLVTYLARLQRDGWSTSPKGIGIDEKTTLAVDSSGNAKVIGTGAVYFLKATTTPNLCEKQQPLEYEAVNVYKIRNSGSFNLKSWNGYNGTSYSLEATSGRLYSTQNSGAIY